MIHELDLRPVLPPWVFDLLALVIGLAVGSFANVCIHRLPPPRQSVVSPPSRCPRCGALIRAFDNVPVLSWFWLRGLCRSCREPISVRYPLVEAANGLVYLGLAMVGGASVWTLVAMPFATALLVLALIDYDVQLLPDVITLPGTALGIAVSFMFGWGDRPAWPVGPWESMGSAAGGYLALLLVAKTWEKGFGKEALGQGDWKMAAFLGACLGWQKMLLVVFLASLGGTAVALSAVALRRADWETKFPLGTFLAVAGIFTLFGGDHLLAWYRGPFSHWIQGFFGG